MAGCYIKLSQLVAGLVPHDSQVLQRISQCEAIQTHGEFSTPGAGYVSIEQGWAISFAPEKSSEVSQNEGLHHCSHNNFYYNKVICHLTYANQNNNDSFHLF